MAAMMAAMMTAMMAAMMTAMMAGAPQRENLIAGVLIALVHSSTNYTCQYSQILTSATAEYISSATIMAATSIKNTA